MLILRDIVKVFPGVKSPAVDNVNLTIAEGETVVLLGSSGCGKSTILKMVNRLIEPDSGEILFQQRPVKDITHEKLRRSIGYVIQGIGLFPHWTVADNIGAILRLEGVSAYNRRKRIHALLEMVGLPEATFAERYPEELSGGQQQRVGVARALAADPDLLLMDEPFGALDGVNREKLQKELLLLKHDLRKTILFVTHDLFEAIMLADRIAVMHNGRLEQVGKAEELINAPATPFVKQLFEKPAQQLALYSKKRIEIF